jgi:hypothetical protein
MVYSCFGESETIIELKLQNLGNPRRIVHRTFTHNIHNWTKLYQAATAKTLLPVTISAWLSIFAKFNLKRFDPSVPMWFALELCAYHAKWFENGMRRSQCV